MNGWLAVMSNTMVAIATTTSRSTVLRLKSQKGSTVIEYGLIATLISILAIVVIQQIGLGVESRYNTVAEKMP